MALTKVSFGAAGIPGYEIGDKSLPAVILIQVSLELASDTKRRAGFNARKRFTAAALRSLASRLLPRMRCHHRSGGAW